MSLSVVGDFGWLYFGAYMNYVLVGILVYLFWHAFTSPDSIISQRESTFKILMAKFPCGNVALVYITLH